MSNPNHRNHLAEMANSLLETASAAEWNSFLFGIQTTLIASGHLESMTQAGSQDFASKFAALKAFFDSAREVGQ